MEIGVNCSFKKKKSSIAMEAHERRVMEARIPHPLDELSRRVESVEEKQPPPFCCLVSVKEGIAR